MRIARLAIRQGNVFMLSSRLAASRAAAFLLLIALGLAGCSCGAPSAPDVPLSSRPSFGELVYRILKQQLQQSDTCAPQYVTAVETHHADFVTTFDYVIEHGVQDGFPELLGGTIKPFIDNDKLPRLVDTLAATIALLVSDQFDPNRDTIHAIVNLAEAQSLLESSMAIQLVAAVLEDPTIQDKVHALAVVAQENDGVTYLMDDMFDVASYALSEDPTPSTCSGVVTPDVQSTLLRTQGFVEDARFNLGTPFYIARPDVNGNPAVTVNGNALAGPFVDANHDHVADTNLDGEPVDAAGAVIDLPMIGEDSAAGRDAYGRAVDSANAPIYQYYDVKRTALSYAIQIGADLFAADVHHRIPAIAGAILGSPSTCTDGTNCRVYPSATNSVADATFVAFEVAKYSRISVLLRTISQLLTTNTTKAENLLVAIGDIVRALDATDISITDTSITDAVSGLVPLLSQIFTAPNASATPTARVLVDVLEGLGAQADALPADINYMIRNQYDANPSSKIEAVNLALPRFPPGGDDNRTGLEQLIELFDYADCGYIGPRTFLQDPVMWALWGVVTAIDGQVQSGTVAYVFVNLLSHQSPNTVSNLIGLLDAIQNLVGGNTLAWAIQNIFGCPGPAAAQTAAHLPALRVLAQSGGLDWILPLAKTFGDQGQLRLLVDIFGYLATDFRRDEDASVTTVSSLRRLMPALQSMTTAQTAGVATSTPLNRVLDTLDVLLTVPASDGNGNSVDVVIDALAYMTTTRTVQTRTTAVANTSYLVELLKSVKTMQTRLALYSAGPQVSAVLDAVTPLLTQTTGTGASRRLANPNLRLLSATLLDAVAQAASLPAASYQCYIADVQTESVAFLNSKHFATLVRIVNHLASSPNANALEDWMLTMMRGRPANQRQLELYGRALQLAAGASSANVSGDDLAQIASWFGAGLRVSGAGGVREIVSTLDQLLATDTNHTILTMLRTVITAGPLASHERPVSTFVDTASDVNAVDSANMCMATGTHLNASSLENAIQGISDFLVRNPSDGTSTGVEQIWSLVGTLAPAE